MKGAPQLTRTTLLFHFLAGLKQGGAKFFTRIRFSAAGRSPSVTSPSGFVVGYRDVCLITTFNMVAAGIATHAGAAG
jgi:hypothetical protein